MNKKKIIKWKWKNTIIDFNAISDELADYGNYLTKKYMVFHYLGTPDNEIHEWYNGGYSCEYNSALTYAKQLGLVENYIDYEDRIYNLQNALDEIEKIILKATTDEETGKDLGYSDNIPYYDLLEIIQKAKGEVKNEN